MFSFLLLALSGVASAQDFYWPVAPVDGDAGMLASFDEFGEPAFTDPADIVEAAVDECNVQILDAIDFLSELTGPAIPLHTPGTGQPKAGIPTVIVYEEPTASSTTSGGATVNETTVGLHRQEGPTHVYGVMSIHVVSANVNSPKLGLYSVDPLTGDCDDLIWLSGAVSAATTGVKTTAINAGGWTGPCSSACSYRDVSTDKLRMERGSAVCKLIQIGNGAGAGTPSFRTMAPRALWGRSQDFSARPWSGYETQNSGGTVPTSWAFGTGAGQFGYRDASSLVMIGLGD